MQGIMLSKDLKIQQDKKDDEHEANMLKLQDEVAKLWNSLEDKETEIVPLKKNLAKAKEKEQSDFCMFVEDIKMPSMNVQIAAKRFSLRSRTRAVDNLLLHRPRLIQRRFVFKPVFLRLSLWLFLNSHFSYLSIEQGAKKITKKWEKAEDELKMSLAWIIDFLGEGTFACK